MRILWTDGSAMPNPGPGGYAVIEGGKPVRLGRSSMTTNIRMEAMALIAAIEYAKEIGEECLINTDSEFWINVITVWAKGWKENGWRKSKNKPVKNLDLVQKLDAIYTPNLVKLKWTRGHVGVAGNELADTWANKARMGESLPGVEIKEV